MDRKSGTDSNKKLDLVASLQLNKDIQSLKDKIESVGKIPQDSDFKGTFLDSSTGKQFRTALDQLSPLLEKLILEDMDRNRQYIQVCERCKFVLIAYFITFSTTIDLFQDGVELGILSRELPDRLIVYHTVIQDPQVNTAYELASGKLDLPQSKKIEDDRVQSSSLKITQTKIDPSS